MQGLQDEVLVMMPAVQMLMMYVHV